MNEASKSQLELFVAKSEKALGFSYFKTLEQNNGTKVTLSWSKEKGRSVSHNFPDEEAIDALMMTARMFIQNNDQISFDRLKELKSDSNISDGWKANFDQIRGQLNSFLDQSTSITINEKAITYREILYVFLYGEIAHSNVQKRKTYESWKQHEVAFPFLQSEFHRTIIVLHNAVRILAHYTRKELAGDHIMMPQQS